MLSTSPGQPVSRFGSAPFTASRSVDDGDASTCDLSSSSSPTIQKKGGLFKSLKRIGNLLSGHSANNLGGVEDSDPSHRLGHALTMPELPTPVPGSASASPRLASYMSIPCSQRRDPSVRGGGGNYNIGSPPAEPHSPSSPFPSAGRCLMMQQRCSRDYSAKAEGAEVRCHIRQVAAPRALAATDEHSQPLSSPVTVCLPLSRELSPTSSSSSGLGRLDEKLPDVSAVPTPALPTLEPLAPATPAPPAPFPASLALPPTTLLAINPALPSAMRRRTWCLEDYNVVKRLYKGGSASVYKATCLRSGLPVALKVYFLTRVPRNVVHMVKREIELHHRLVHPNIIQLYGAFLDGDRIVLVQEYAARGDLFHLLRQLGGRMTEPQVSELVMRPFLDAMAYLHSNGICHRDIKPENILYTDKWVLKVADFGVSIDLNQERAVTRAGTIDYMAPEVTRCPLKALPTDNKHDKSLAYTYAVDVWAAGILAYELLVGFTPAVAPQMVKVPAGASAYDFLPPSPSGGPPFPASLSAAVRSFISGALSDDPGDRPTAVELLRHTWIAHPPSAAVAPSSQ